MINVAPVSQQFNAGRDRVCAHPASADPGVVGYLCVYVYRPSQVFTGMEMFNMENPHLVDSDTDDGVLVPPVEGGAGIHSVPSGATVTDRPFGSEVAAQSWTPPYQDIQEPNVGATARQEDEKMHKAKAKAEEEERVSAQQRFVQWPRRIEIALIPDAALGVLPLCSGSVTWRAKSMPSANTLALSRSGKISTSNSW